MSSHSETSSATNMKNLIPQYEFDRITDIPDSLLSQFELIIFDADNTLVLDKKVESTPEITEWLKKLCGDKSCIIVSNSPSFYRWRGEILKEQFAPTGVVLSRFRKPSKKIYRAILKQTGRETLDNCIIIGDRVLTDVRFGNRFGLTTILVKPIGRYRWFYMYPLVLFERALLVFAKRYTK